MSTFKKYPRSIFGAIGAGLKLGAESFSKTWYLILTYCVSFFLLGKATGLTQFVVNDFVLEVIIRTIFIALIGWPLSIFFNALIYTRMHSVESNSHQSFMNSIKIAFRKMWMLMGFLLISGIGYFLLCVLYYFIFKPINLPVIFVMLVLLTLFVIGIFLFFSYYMILIDNKSILRSIKDSFFCVKRNFMSLFLVLSFLFFVEFIISILFAGSSGFFLKVTNLISKYGSALGGISWVYLFLILFYQYSAYIFKGINLSIFYNAKAKDGL